MSYEVRLFTGAITIQVTQPSIIRQRPNSTLEGRMIDDLDSKPVLLVVSVYVLCTLYCS